MKQKQSLSTGGKQLEILIRLLQLGDTRNLQ